MIYCDSSALVKLYVQEPYSAWVREQLVDKTAIATARISLPEMLSALTRRLKSGDLRVADYEVLHTDLIDDWSAFNILEFDERLAADLVKQHGLRGCDAVQLSSALLLRDELEMPLYFMAFDNPLATAARSAGLLLLHPLADSSR